MGFWKRAVRTLLTTGAVALSLPLAALAAERVGVVTNVEGTATVTRVALLQAQPLRFKDDVYLHDRITTGDRSIVRVLLGGKATVTARERSVVTITEVPGVATVELGSGRISVAVSKAMMKPGDVIQIKTPNAISAVRGTVVVAEVFSGASVISTITVLRGLVDVTRLDPTGHRVGLAVDVGALQAISITGSSPLSQPTRIGADEANRLKSEFRVVPGNAPSAATAPAVQQAVRQATRDAEALVSVGNSGKRKGGDGDSDHGNGSENDKKDNGSSDPRTAGVGNGGNESSGKGSGVSVSVGSGGGSAPSVSGTSGSGSSGSGGSGSGGGRGGVNVGVNLPVTIPLVVNTSGEDSKKSGKK